MTTKDGMLSQAQRRALQDAFEKGQQAWREGKGDEANPYPLEAEDYRDHWVQGWQAERGVHFDSDDQ